jgi:hypothetical protein
MTFRDILLALRQKHITSLRTDSETESASVWNFMRDDVLDFSQDFTLSG